MSYRYASVALSLLAIVAGGTPSVVHADLIVLEQTRILQGTAIASAPDRVISDFFFHEAPMGAPWDLTDVATATVPSPAGLATSQAAARQVSRVDPLEFGAVGSSMGAAAAPSVVIRRLSMPGRISSSRCTVWTSA